MGVNGTGCDKFGVGVFCCVGCAILNPLRFHVGSVVLPGFNALISATLLAASSKVSPGNIFNTSGCLAFILCTLAFSKSSSSFVGTSNPCCLNLLIALGDNEAGSNFSGRFFLG